MGARQAQRLGDTVEAKELSNLILRMHQGSLKDMVADLGWTASSERAQRVLVYTAVGLKKTAWTFGKWM
jgi:hypothetical protein